MADDTVSYTNGWTPVMEQYHLRTMEKSDGYAWMHLRAANFYRHVFLALMIPVSLLGVLLGSAGLASLSAVADDPLWWLYIIIFAGNIVMGGLQAVNGLLEPNLTSFQHREIAMEAIHFRRRVETELLTEPLRRIGCNEFTEMVNLEYDTFLKNTIPVPDHIVRSYERQVNDDMAKPEMVIPFNVRRQVDSECPCDGGASNIQRNRPSPLWLATFCKLQQASKRTADAEMTDVEV